MLVDAALVHASKIANIYEPCDIAPMGVVMLEPDGRVPPMSSISAIHPLSLYAAQPEDCTVRLAKVAPQGRRKRTVMWLMQFHRLRTFRTPRMPDRLRFRCYPVERELQILHSELQNSQQDSSVLSVFLTPLLLGQFFFLIPPRIFVAHLVGGNSRPLPRCGLSSITSSVQSGQEVSSQSLLFYLFSLHIITFFKQSCRALCTIHSNAGCCKHHPSIIPSVPYHSYHVALLV